MTDTSRTNENWPPLPLEQWQQTYDTLHMWTQIIGKIRLALTPIVNHWWNVTLYVSARGLTTSPIPYEGRVFDMEFDFVDHQLVIRASDGRTRYLRLIARSVADFYQEVMDMLASLEIEVKIWPMPVEVPNPIPLDKNHVYASYDPEAVSRLWRILVSVDTVLKEFRSQYVGKCSPVHFFWGSFDLCVTRFSGRPAPPRTGADAVTLEAYSQEVISAGFWPGSGSTSGPAFYCYAAPEPRGFADAAIQPKGAHYDRELGEFILMYDDVRGASDPRRMLLDFLQSTYEAGATLGKWDRAALEKPPEQAAHAAGGSGHGQ